MIKTMYPGPQALHNEILGEMVQQATLRAYEKRGGFLNLMPFPALSNWGLLF